MVKIFTKGDRRQNYTADSTSIWVLEEIEI